MNSKGRSLLKETLWLAFLVGMCWVAVGCKSPVEPEPPCVPLGQDGKVEVKAGQVTCYVVTWH